MFCPSCATPADADSKFCKNCGTHLPLPEVVPQESAEFFEQEPVMARPKSKRNITILLVIAIVGLISGGIAIANAGNSNSTDYSSSTDLTDSTDTTELAPIAVDWAPAGYEQYDDDLAYKWVTDEGDWPCDDCNFWKLKVVSHYGCPSGVYAEINMLDADDNVVDWTNDSIPSLRVDQSAILIFENYPYDDNLDYGQIASMTCHY